jgi:prepilin-type N-terminal cleavage/methylation domain-containing protein
MKKRKSNGFTLFELLVTISIIAVLTAVAVVSYGGLNKKTRDSRRVADLEKIRISLEAARQIGNTYPSTIASLVSGGYLDKQPVDPKTKLTTTYVYSRPTSYTYNICAQVEEVGSTSSDSSSCGSAPAGYVGYYRVVNP